MDARREAQLVFERLAQDYDRSDVEFFGPAGERLVDHVGVSPGNAVLDIGCGRGAVLFAAARAVGEGGRVTGIDLSPAMVASVLAEAEQSGLRWVNALVLEAQEPAFPPESFDVITGGMSVHMLADTLGAFRSYHQLLCPGGRLGLSAPVTVVDPAPEVFGLRSIARLCAAHDAGSGIYPYAEAFGGARKARSDLRAAGFVQVKVREEPAFITAGSSESFLRWTWTHGMRALWERVSPRERDGAEDEIKSEAHARSEHGDRIVLRVPVMYVTAARPAP
ncbi:class I SAM-dependent methyltransferase [Streptomyces decoyicus]|uniref:Class I SAM-dependent methyltransferase n=1 Tax=Streptomyces decoyicus TaxID=249567 RepID=A0ABZ1FAV1_9ACTN|nr:methyltransferase domain-containing protein [Streptomyces decoyicus]WSB67135.1 class I SAM-dependent methyltransferase [Streptomyces decoyicus]